MVSLVFLTTIKLQLLHVKRSVCTLNPPCSHVNILLLSDSTSNKFQTRLRAVHHRLSLMIKCKQKNEGERYKYNFMEGEQSEYKLSLRRNSLRSRTKLQLILSLLFRTQTLHFLLTLITPVNVSKAKRHNQIHRHSICCVSK